MSDLSSRNALLDAMPKNDELLSVDVRRIICEAPKVDAVPMRHGRLVENGRCTNCGGHAPFWAMETTYYKSPYCHECGAKMDGGAGNG